MIAFGFRVDCRYINKLPPMKHHPRNIAIWRYGSVNYTNGKKQMVVLRLPGDLQLMAFKERPS